MKEYGRLAAKILELLATGVVLGFARDKALRRKLFEESDRIWYELDRRQLYQVLQRLKLQKAIEVIKKSDGIEKVKLTHKGKAYALAYQFRRLKIGPRRHWDERWRMVLFDIPETRKKIRDAFRRKLKNLGFLEFQKSVFVHPYPCREEVNFVINFFDLADHVYYIEAPIVPDGTLRSHFKLK